MSNIREVARLAGVSVATVSRALKTADSVSPKTRKLVLEAVEKAGYRPNLLARNFSSGKSFAVVVLVPNVANPFYSRVIRGIEQAAQDKGYSILLGDTQGKAQREHVYAGMALTNQADGLIQLDCRYPFAEKDSHLAASVPLVNACERMTDDGIYPIVELDNQGAARAMTRHLVELGHKRIGVITGPTHSPIVRDRLMGFKSILLESGLEYDESLIIKGEFTMPSGAQGAATLLTGKTPPTAIFCMNDEMAIGAVHQIKKAGLCVPDDISVAGFDNIEFSCFADPPLTTINQPAEELGGQAMQMLFQRIEDRSQRASRIMLSFDLIKRESTGPCTK